MIKVMANNQEKLREKDLDLKPIHPGEILREELLIPLKISVKQLVKGTQIKLKKSWRKN
jgi:hypothetical protein